MNQSTFIHIELPNTSQLYADKCREIIGVMFAKGVFNLRNGKAIMSFDHESNFIELEVDVKAWKRNKPDTPLAKFQEGDTIKLTTNP